MVDVTRRIAALSPLQQEELLRRLRVPASSPRAVATSTPTGALSFAEERLWFLQNVVPESTAYNVAIAAELEGVLDVDALKGAVERVVGRHEALRTTFVADAGRPRRVVSQEARFEFEMRDLADMPAAIEEARGLVRAAAWRPFALGEGPLLRVVVARVQRQRTVISLVTHHIVSDGWSLRLLTRDLWAYYRELARGIPARLPELTRRYSDYSDQQRLAGSRPRPASIEYWKRELALATRLQFGAPAASPAAAVPRAVIHQFPLDAELVAALSRLARAERATTFMIVAAAWSVVLARYAAGADFLIGFPSTNRPTEDLEQVVGLFANTVVVRVPASGRQSGRQLVRHLKQQVIDALDHELPFSALVREAKLGASDATTPLIQAMCVVDDGPEDVPEIDDLRIRPFLVETANPKFDLSLILTRDARGVRCAFEADCALFAPGDVDAMARDLEAVLSMMATTPDARLDDLPSARRQMPSSAAQDTLHGEAVHDTIAAVAAAHPHAEAVRAADGTLTYADLLERAERIARVVRGVVDEPGARIGVCLPRSADAVVAVLGILRAGAAYVPIAPGGPAERIKRIGQDARCKLVFVGEGQHFDGAPTTTVAAALAAAPHAASPRGAAVDPGQLAYVIYTSGTTGEPKGVMVSHRNLTASTAARITEYGAPVRRFLWVSPLVFDSSVVGLFWTLYVGGTLVIPEERELTDPVRLRRIISETGTTHTLCLPSLYAAILRAGGPQELASLQVVIVAGESCPAELPAAHARIVPGARLYNEYGPTEGTVWSTVHRCSPDEGSRVPIGRPVPGTYARILDAFGRPVPPRGVGELCVGGPGVAIGYMGRPDTTAERFVPDPFGSGARLYRTGDLASERHDGLLDFHGRVDRQVKVRGVRVDPGEVEAHLLGHPGVRSAAVVGRSLAGHMALVAYVAREHGAALDGPLLRAYLRERLPDALTPAHYCILDDLPRTSTGKVDFHALPEPHFERAGARPPSTDTERTIAAAWAAVLGLPAPGVDDNFFDAGGHSMLLMALHAALVDRFAALSIVDLLEHPTIAQLAAFLDRGGDRSPSGELPIPIGLPSRRGAEARRKRRAANRS